MKELKLEELSIEQKIGMAMAARAYVVNEVSSEGYSLQVKKENDCVFDLIKKHALGAVWVNPGEENATRELIQKIKAAADYPILVICDAESGLQEFHIGKHNAIGCTDNKELAYTFGKVTGLVGRRMGYNVICNPILDIAKERSVCGHNVRALGSQKEKVAELAAEIAHGLKDVGILTVGKHYPSSQRVNTIDSHMAEPLSDETKEELLEENLYAYRKLNDAGLLDGIMTGHTRFANIDPDYPASLSSKVISIFRECGFDGFAITDALSMMGIVAKFGKGDSKGLAIAQGNDLALPWEENEFSYHAMCETYKKGILTEEQINSAARHILMAQHKTLAAPKYTELTEKDAINFDRINRESIFAKADNDMPIALSKEGKHLFVVMVKSEQAVSADGSLDVATMIRHWYHPEHIMERLQKEFPNSKVMAVNEFSSIHQNWMTLEESVKFEDVVYITFTDCLAYSGRECFTSRIISTIEALQITNRVSTIVHFGNPFVLEDLPHIPRVIIGCVSENSVDYSLDILEGKMEAKGKLTCEIHLK